MQHHLRTPRRHHFLTAPPHLRKPHIKYLIPTSSLERRPYRVAPPGLGEPHARAWTAAAPALRTDRAAGRAPKYVSSSIPRLPCPLSVQQADFACSHRATAARWPHPARRLRTPPSGAILASTRIATRTTTTTSINLRDAASHFQSSSPAPVFQATDWISGDLSCPWTGGPTVASRRGERPGRRRR